MEANSKHCGSLCPKRTVRRWLHAYKVDVPNSERVENEARRERRAVPRKTMNVAVWRGTDKEPATAVCSKWYVG